MNSISELWCKLWHLHRSDDDTSAATIMEFFVPKLKRGFFLRMGIVAVCAFIICKWLLIPCVIDGESMMPTYPARGFTFCWTGKYWFNQPKRGDVVIVKYVERVFFLKRVVALPGDTVQFVNGILFINGKPLKESYVRYISNWNTKPVKVSPGHCYVVGDNRSQYIEHHRFGQIRSGRIVGAPLF